MATKDRHEEHRHEEPQAGHLDDLTVRELHERAREDGVEGRSSMRKSELVDAVAAAEHGADDASRGAGPDGGHKRTGDQTSSSLKYAQEVASPDDEPEREGRTLVTTHHDRIREWAHARGGVPATVDGTEHGDHLGVLRIEFRTKDAAKARGAKGTAEKSTLREVTWDEWFATFDERRLNFIHQEDHKDGSPSTFFRLESPDREDG